MTLKDFGFKETIKYGSEKYAGQDYANFKEKVLATLQRLEAKIDNIESQTRRPIRCSQ